MKRPAVFSVLFFLSGGTALLYQVAFGKKLATIFGATAYAVSAVLAAFMAGLALGAHLGGRYGQRIRRPLAAYGYAEIAVGVVCAVTPWLFDAVAAMYLALVQGRDQSLVLASVARTLITALVVVVPTVAMGLTLPLLSRALASGGADPDEQRQSRRRLGRLYALNTAGGALGALLAAYWIIPALGIYRTMRAAALVNLVIGAIGIALGSRSSAPRVDPESPDDPNMQTQRSATSARPIAAPLPQRERILLGTLAFFSGLLVFCTEVVDTHLLTLLIGNSAYAFGLMLAAFLTCLSIGAALAGSLEERVGAARALPVSLAAAALALLLTLPMWGQLPRAFLSAGHRIYSWAGREAVRAGVAFVALALPTLAMGLTFPLLLRRVAGRRDVAAGVGRLTLINTVGAITGSIACGYLMLPALGSEWSLRAIALAFAGCAALAWAEGEEPERRFHGLAAPAVVGLLALVIPRWDMMLMTNGANVYFDTQPRPDALLMVREDVHGGLTSVALRGKVRTLYTNGKFQGDDGHELVAQRSFAHFPSLFVKGFDRALVIGLGTGTTLGTIASYPYKRIDVAEISPAIVEAAGKFFPGPNLGSLKDERVDLIMNDGRNVLLLARDPYDLIAIELTSVWFAGAANLYSKEFYKLCRERLGPKGVLQQWVQLHHIRREEVAVVLRTLREAFPHVALFVSGGQGIIVASASPLTASRAHIDSLSTRPEVRATFPGKPDKAPLAALIDKLLVSGPELDRFVAETPGEPIVSTDENLYLEYATPKGNTMSYVKSLRSMVAELRTYRIKDPASRHLTK